MLKTNDITADVCVIGSGLAGVSAALSLPSSLKVCIFSSTMSGMNASSYAQGGIAAVTTTGDNFNLHTQDTLRSGADLCDHAAVSCFTENAEAAIHWLLSQGVIFSKKPDGSFDLTREGGHCRPRILHSQDETGKQIMAVLSQNLHKASNITSYDNFTAIDFEMQDKLIRAVKFLNNDSGDIGFVRARCFILASGGASGIYLNSTNPDAAMGEGIAMAWRSGCRLANLEFNQFHPTSMYTNAERPMLISEALRGEGAYLCDADGHRFMQKYDEKQELATRDIVARSMFLEMQEKDLSHLFLDISHKQAKWIKNRFPALYRGCRSYGIDITKEKIPVVPASHYSCGGILVDQNGKTDVKNLYAIGECAYTGFHGANRLASNSLTECVVTAKLASSKIESEIDSFSLPGKCFPDITKANLYNDDFLPQVKEIKKIMWDFVGIIRSSDGLQQAKKLVISLKQDIDQAYMSLSLTRGLLEARNIALISHLTIVSALSRKESRGGHFCSDYPELSPEYNQKPTVIRHKNKVSMDKVEIA